MHPILQDIVPKTTDFLETMPTILLFLYAEYLVKIQKNSRMTMQTSPLSGENYTFRTLLPAGGSFTVFYCHLSPGVEPEGWQEV